MALHHFEKLEAPMRNYHLRWWQRGPLFGWIHKLKKHMHKKKTEKIRRKRVLLSPETMVLMKYEDYSIDQSDSFVLTSSNSNSSYSTPTKDIEDSDNTYGGAFPFWEFSLLPDENDTVERKQKRELDRDDITVFNLNSADDCPQKLLQSMFAAVDYEQPPTEPKKISDEYYNGESVDDDDKASVDEDTSVDEAIVGDETCDDVKSLTDGTSSVPVEDEPDPSPVKISITMAPYDELEDARATVYSPINMYSTPTTAAKSDAMATEFDEMSQISLEKFMEVQKVKSSCRPPLPPSRRTARINLGEISTDIMSDTSASLSVSYEGNFPQLVLQPSLDDNSSLTRDEYVDHDDDDDYESSTVGSRSLGIQFSHPACSGRASVSDSSFETNKYNMSCTQWLNNNIDKAFKQFDIEKNKYHNNSARTNNNTRNSSRQNSRQHRSSYVDNDDDAANEDDGTLKTAISTLPSSHMSETTTTNDKKGDVSSTDSDTEIPWPFSEETNAKATALTRMIEKEVVWPILKPLCEFVDATEIQESGGHDNSPVLYKKRRRRTAAAETVAVPPDSIVLHHSIADETD